MQVPLDQQSIEEIIEAFYTSAIGGTPVLQAVQLLQNSFGAASAQIFSMSSDEKVTFTETIVAHNPKTHAAVSEKVIEENWEGLEVGVDPRMAYSATLPAGFVFHDHQFITDRAINKHPFYQDFLRKFDLRYGAGANLEAASPTHQTLLSFNHSAKQGAIADEQIRAFAAIVPHAQRAMRMRNQLQQKEAVNQSLMQLLDERRVGIALLDRNGEVLEMNAALTRIIENSDGLIYHGKTLRPSSAIDQKAFKALLTTALGASTLAPTRFAPTFIHRPSGEHRYIANVVPVDTQKDSLSAIRPTTPLQSVRAVLSIWDPSNSSTPHIGVVRSYFDLTNKEAILACDLASGLTLNQIAELRCITVQTARSHLKSIFAKTAITRQSDLVRLVANLL